MKLLILYKAFCSNIAMVTMTLTTITCPSSGPQYYAVSWQSHCQSRKNHVQDNVMFGFHSAFESRFKKRLFYISQPFDLLLLLIMGPPPNTHVKAVIRLMSQHVF
eukprot:645497-Amphidinium_carterae.1